MMYKRNPTPRISFELANLRKTHRNALRKALSGLRISEIDIDRLYARKLNNINILEEFINNDRKKR